MYFWEQYQRLGYMNLSSWFDIKEWFYFVWDTSISNDYPRKRLNLQSLPHYIRVPLRHIHWQSLPENTPPLVAWVTRRVSLLEQELLTLPEHLRF
jgi:hypothetical protein